MIPKLFFGNRAITHFWFNFDEILKQQRDANTFRSKQ